MRVLRLVALCAVAALLGACATIVEGTDQSVTVVSDPSGAICELEREGTLVAVVNPTPGTARIDKSRENITVSCAKDGYQRTATALSSEFQGMTFGNILFGGLIGVAVDAGSGAMNEYPAQVTVRLTPDGFPDEPSRDRHFDREITISRAEAEAEQARIRQTCTAGADCSEALTSVTAALDARVADLSSRGRERGLAPSQPGDGGRWRAGPAKAG